MQRPIVTSQKQSLAGTLRALMSNIRQNYFEFLSSLKFENANEKQRYKPTKKSLDRMQQQLFDLLHKTYRFEQQMTAQNTGYAHFVRLVENIRELQRLNNRLCYIVLSRANSTQIGESHLSRIDNLHEFEMKLPPQYKRTTK